MMVLEAIHERLALQDGIVIEQGEIKYEIPEWPWALQAAEQKPLKDLLVESTRNGAAFVFQAFQAQAFTAWTLDQPERIG
jgi:hypothetical protein